MPNPVTHRKSPPQLPAIRQALAFLEAVKPREGYRTLCAIDPEPKSSRGVIKADVVNGHHGEFIARWNGQHNLHWSPNLTATPLAKKPGKEDIRFVEWLSADIDDFASDALQRLQSYVPAPTAIIASGGGFQGFWRLRDPIEILGEAKSTAWKAEVERVEACNRKLRDDLGGDDTQNIDRLMRLPFTVNVPNKTKTKKGRLPASAWLVSCDLSRTYDLEDFLPADIAMAVGPTVAAPAPLATPVGQSANDGWPRRDKYPSGSEHLQACVGVAVRKGLPDPAIQKLFADHEHAAKQADPERAVQRCIDRARSDVAKLPSDDEALAGIVDSRVVELLRPRVAAGAVLAASDYVPDPTAARVAFRALRESLYLQGGQVVEVVPGRHGAALALIDEKALVDRLSIGRQVLHVHMRNSKTGERFSADPGRLPVAQAALMLKSRAVREELRHVEMVLRRPAAVERDGQLVALVPGYNEGGIFVVGGEPLPDVPLAEAVKALPALLDEFQFGSDSDRSRAVASLIQPGLVFSGMLRGPLPIVLLEADQPQAGKGILTSLQAGLYGERRQLVTQRQGGVGSLDESVSAALLRGLPFVCLDNYRGRLDSPFLEAVITAGHDLLPVRVPHRGEVLIDAARFVFQITSNGIELTADQSHRVLVVRIVKRPEGFQFRKYPEGSLLSHVESRQAYYSGCVVAVLRRWFEVGKPRNPVAHTFVELGAMDWIVRELFGLRPLLHEHREIMVRLASPEESFLRALALAIERNERLGRWLQASALVDIALAAGLEPNNGWREGDSERHKQLGFLLRSFFAKTEVRDLGHLRMAREIVKECGRPTKRYCLWRPADGSPPRSADHDDPPPLNDDPEGM